MRNIIIKLNELYGAHNNRELTSWFNEQAARVGTFEGGAISLVDIDEKRITQAIKTLSASVPLSASQLVSYTDLIPAMNKSQLEFEAIARFKSDFYAFLLQASGEINIDALSLAKDNDKFERHGHDRHVTHIPNEKSSEGSIALAYVNGSIPKLNASFSVVLNKNEVEEIKSSQIKGLFNGVDPYSEHEWEDVYKAAVMERLYDEGMFKSIEHLLGDDALNTYTSVKEFNEERFRQQEGAKLKIYSSFGKHIATKKFRFSASQKLQLKKQKPPLTLVSNTGAKVANENTQSDVVNEEGILQEFGGF